MLSLTFLLFTSYSLVSCQVSGNYDNQAGQGGSVQNDPRLRPEGSTFGTVPYGTGRDGFQQIGSQNPNSALQFSPQYDPLRRFNQFYNQLPPFIGLDNPGYQPELYNFNPGFYQIPGSYNSNFPLQDFGFNDPIFRPYDIQRTPYNDPRNYQFNDRNAFNLPTDPAYRPNRPISNPFYNPNDPINQPPLDPSRRPLLDPIQRPPSSFGQRPNTFFDVDPNRPINQPRFGPSLNPGLRSNPNFDRSPTHPINHPSAGSTLRPFQDPAPGSVPDYGQRLGPGTFNRPNLYSGQTPNSDSIYRPVGGLEPRPFSSTLPPSRRFPDPTQQNVLGPVPKAFPPSLNNRPIYVPPRPQSHFSPEYFAEPSYQPSGIEPLGRAGPQYSSSSPAPQSKSNISSAKLGTK